MTGTLATSTTNDDLLHLHLHLRLPVAFLEAPPGATTSARPRKQEQVVKLPLVRAL